MAILLNYNLETDFNPSTQASGLSGGALTNSALSYFVRDTLAYGTGTYQGVVNPPDSTTTSTLAVTNNSYFNFTATPSSGNSISLTSLDFKIARGGASTPRGYVVRSSIDGYASNLATADVSTQRTTFTDVSVDLTGTSFQNLSSPITFRIYFYAPTSSNSLDFDEVTLNGSVSAGGSSLSPSASLSPSSSSSASLSPSSSMSPSASLSPSSSVSPSSVSDGLPVTPIALYWPYWTPVQRLSAWSTTWNVIILFHAYPANGEVTGGNTGAVVLRTPSGTIGTQLNADIATCRARGQKILVSVGGAGGQVYITTQSRADAFVQSIKDMNLTLGSGTGQTANFDGIDFNNFEGGGSQGEWMAYAALQLKDYYGSNFIISSPPAAFTYTTGGQAGLDRAVLAAMHRGGTYGSYTGTALDWMCPQFYDPSNLNTVSNVRTALDWYNTSITVAGSTTLGTSTGSVQIPRTKIGIGFAIKSGSADTSRWSTTTASSAYATMVSESKTPRGAFNWAAYEDPTELFISGVAPTINLTGSPSLSPSASKSPSSSISASKSPSASISPSSSASSSTSRSLSPSSSISSSPSSSASSSQSPSPSKSPSASISSSPSLSNTTTITVATDYWSVTLGEIPSPSPSLSPSSSVSVSVSPSSSISTSSSPSPVTWSYKNKNSTSWGYKAKNSATWVFKNKNLSR